MNKGTFTKKTGKTSGTGKLVKKSKGKKTKHLA